MSHKIPGFCITQLSKAQQQRTFGQLHEQIESKLFKMKNQYS